MCLYHHLSPSQFSLFRLNTSKILCTSTSTWLFIMFLYFYFEWSDVWLLVILHIFFSNFTKCNLMVVNIIFYSLIYIHPAGNDWPKKVCDHGVNCCCNTRGFDRSKWALKHWKWLNIDFACSIFLVTESDKLLSVIILIFCWDNYLRNYYMKKKNIVIIKYVISQYDSQHNHNSQYNKLLFHKYKRILYWNTTKYESRPTYLLHNIQCDQPSTFLGRY